MCPRKFENFLREISLFLAKRSSLDFFVLLHQGKRTNCIKATKELCSDVPFVFHFLEPSASGGAFFMNNSV